MAYIYIKYILALLLTGLCILCMFIIKNRSRVYEQQYFSGQKGSFYLTQLRVLFATIIMFIEGLHNGMRKHDSFRQFFIRIMIIILVCIQLVDLHAKTCVSSLIANQSQCSNINGVPKGHLELYITSPMATYLCFICTTILFRYKLTDSILSYLHNNRKIFALYGFASLVILFSSLHDIIVAESMFILLFAAYFYPNKIGDADPKGKKPIPKFEKDMKRVVA